ncbi:MAG: hypothetical protein FWG63_00035 [Defluviitaleaceae bacterium]|nr:hypothetical protein [Defluviitaleaceae bacterium]
MNKWTKKRAGEYSNNDYEVYQINGIGWALLKNDKPVGRFKTFKQVKQYVSKQA